MIASEFEAKLIIHGFYFENPGFNIPGVDKDAEGYTAEQIMDILTHEVTNISTNPTGNFVRMVRRRSEQVGMLTYYFKDEKGTEYFKVVVPVSANAGRPMLDTIAIKHMLKQSWCAVKARVGIL